jgi:glycine betaine/proline transport system substrate-binding protein
MIKSFQKTCHNISVFLVIIGLCLGANWSHAQEDEEVEAENENLVTLTYVEWVSEVASTYVVKAVLEELGYDVEIMAVTAALMWQAVASGEADAHVAAWLPTTHEHYERAVKERIENLGPNLKGTQIGLVVPQFVTINSISELNANTTQFGGQIIGIDPGAGLMNKTKQVLEEYNLSNFKLVEGSGVIMTAALGEAILNGQWIVVTGWTPHWKFSQWDLKYLDDPKNIYHTKNQANSKEYIATIVRQGLKEDKPKAYHFLDRFYWEPSDMEQVMIWNTEKEDANPYENAKRWIAENRDKVNKWISP